MGGRAFPDHHPYRESDSEDAAREASAAGADAIVTTQKDQVKLDFAEDWPLPTFAVHIAIEVVAGEEALSGLIVEAVGQADGRTS